MGLFNVIVVAIICITIIGAILLLGSIRNFPTITIHHTYEQVIPPEQEAMTEAQQREYDKQLNDTKDILGGILGNVNQIFGGVTDETDNNSDSE